jgi:hypothetical protein
MDLFIYKFILCCIISLSCFLYFISNSKVHLWFKFKFPSHYYIIIIIIIILLSAQTSQTTS